MPTDKITGEEWVIYGAVEQFWTQNRHFPGSKVIADSTGFSEKFVNEVLSSEKAKRRFILLGIDTNAVPLAQRGELKKGQSLLTHIQIAVVETILNPMDKRSHRVKLESLGVKPATYQGWTSNKIFSEYMTKRANDLFGGSMPLAKEALVRKVMAGDTSAIKLYMEITGVYNKQAGQSTQDFRMLVIRLIEILQRYIKDPALLQLISQEVKQLVEPTPPVITQGEVINGNNSPITSEFTYDQ